MIDEHDDYGDNEGEDLSVNELKRMERQNSVTNDPNYAAFFYSNSRLDPRLPPPSFYSPGQSWQMWPSSSIGRESSTRQFHVIGNGGSFRTRPNLMVQSADARYAADGVGETDLSNDFENEDFAGFQRKKLVDMIQEDFPRTPSPVHTLLQKEQQQSLGFLASTKDDPIKSIRTSKKQFTISGSTEAVMAAAAEVEISFNMEQLSIVHENLGGNNYNAEPFTLASNSTSTKPSYSAKPFSPVQPTKVHPPPQNNKYTNYTPYEPQYQPQNTSYIRPHYQSSHVHYSPQEVSYPPYNPHYPQSAPPMQSYDNVNYAGSVSYDKMTILEDFRLNRSKKYELHDLKGMIVEFSTDQHGSRFIQQKLESAVDSDKDLVFAEIYPMALQLMTDVFGNYVIQKFFEFGTPSQKLTLANLMHGHVLNLSLQMYGCRVVQKALEHVPVDEQTRLVQELEGHVLKCVKDQNGNHVIQKCIECVPLSTNAPFLTASFLSQANQLAMHPYGCRVIQRIFEHGPVEQTLALLNELLKNTGYLIQDQYGNYVIQHILERGKPHERTRIIDFMKGKVLEYSQHKFASNVVEKCVSFGTIDQRQELIEEILAPISVSHGLSDSSTSSGSDTLVVPLHLMMKDQFANYVVQKMLEIVDGEQREMLLTSIKPQLPNLRKYTYGKHILSKVEKLLGLPQTEDQDTTTTTAIATGNPNGYSYHPSSPRPSMSSPRFSGYSRGTKNDGNSSPMISKNDPNEFPPLGSSHPPKPRRK